MSSPNHEARQTADRVRFARAYAAQRLPWFGPALFRSNIIVTEATDVASIDKHYNVYWNPGVVNDIWEKGEAAGAKSGGEGPSELRALQELGFLWVHEISHRLRQHAERREDLLNKRPVPPRDWNIAADFEINDNAWPGLVMPAAYPGMLPKDFGFEDDRLAEEYLQLMDDSDQQFDSLPDEGSGVHGEQRGWETGDRQELSDLDQELIRRKVADLMKHSGSNAIPPNWRNWSENVLTSKTNWRRSLSHRMSVALQKGIGSRVDYSFDRPSRRQAVYHPILTPSLLGDRTARIAIVVDTSGSMGATHLERSLAEVAQIVSTFNYPVTIIPCDERTYEPVRVLAAKEAYSIQSLPGGGRTDMRLGIATAEKLRPRPDVILVLTDGYTAYPQERSATPVVFGLLLEHGDDGRQVPRPPMPPFKLSSVLLIKP